MKSRLFILIVIAGVILSCEKKEVIEEPITKPIDSLAPIIKLPIDTFIVPQMLILGNIDDSRFSNFSGGENCDPLNRFGNVELHTKSFYLHTWNANNSSIERMWGYYYKGVSMTNLILNEINSMPKKTPYMTNQIPPIKIIRAYYLYQLMDLFGNIPLDTAYGASLPKSKTRIEVFNFIENELLNNIPLMDEKLTDNSKITKTAAYTLLAQLYLNAQVYTGTPRWADAIMACNKVINSGKYTLANNYFDNFSAENSLVENILVSQRHHAEGQGGNTFIIENLHDRGGAAVGVKGNPWNGFVSTADNYNIYQSEDKRKRQWLVGRQFAALPGERIIDGVKNTGAAVKSTTSGSGNVIYNLNVRAWGLDVNNPMTNPIDSQLCSGARNVKYYPAEGRTVNNTNSFENDYVLMRYADVLLMKAEAEFRLGNTGSAATLINQIRMRAFGNSSFNVLSPTLEDIRGERTRELMLEGYSRRDNIRFEIAGSAKKYWTMARQPLKPNADADTHYMILPIPEKELLNNPNLKQNPGY